MRGQRLIPSLAPQCGPQQPRAREERDVPLVAGSCWAEDVGDAHNNGLLHMGLLGFLFLARWRILSPPWAFQHCCSSGLRNVEASQWSLPPQPHTALRPIETCQMLIPRDLNGI